MLARDQERDGEWSRVEFAIEDVEKFRFEEVNTTFIVISFGIQFARRDGRIWVVLNELADCLDSLPNLPHYTAYAVGASCTWSAAPYEESTE